MPALSREKSLILLYTKEKGADQPAHARRLISTFSNRSSETMTVQHTICRISIFYHNSL